MQDHGAIVLWSRNRSAQVVIEKGKKDVRFHFLGSVRSLYLGPNGAYVISRALITYKSVIWNHKVFVLKSRAVRWSVLTNFFSRKRTKPILQVTVKQFGRKGKSEVKAGSGKLEARRDRSIIGCAQGHFLLCSEDVGKRGLSGKVLRTRSHKRRSHTFRSHRFYIKFYRDYYNHDTVIRILNHLIRGSISLCGNSAWYRAL
jgi:hypothetical protein